VWTVAVLNISVLTVACFVAFFVCLFLFQFFSVKWKQENSKKTHYCSWNAR